MPQKSTKQTTTTKKNTKESDIKKKTTAKKVKQSREPKEAEKKVVIKRRKKDLTPTKASATAIISQANRAKKQALIEKLSEEEMPIKQEVKNNTSSSKVPLRVRILFWWSLLWFCVAFYLAIIHPQIERNGDDIQVSEDFYWSSDTKEEKSVWDADLSVISNEKNDEIEENKIVENDNIIENPQNPEELIQSYFAYMSHWKFDESFALFDNRAQNDQNIKKYFAASQMEPFFGWIEWKSIVPKNIQKTARVYRWKDVYTFDISYTSSSTHEQYDETWEFVPDEYDWERKISRIYCVSSKCWNHPIFWP